jgi:mono/diheme cytochrome c family protein
VVKTRTITSSERRVEAKAKGGSRRGREETMKKLRITPALAAVLCWAGGGALLTSYAQTTAKMAPEELGGANLYNQNCVTCHGARAEGGGGCMMMSGPPLLPAVRRMNAKAFLDEVRHVGETNMCAGHLLDLSSADVEAIRNYLLQLSKQTKVN